MKSSRMHLLRIVLQRTVTAVSSPTPSKWIIFLYLSAELSYSLPRHASQSYLNSLLGSAAMLSCLLLYSMGFAVAGGFILPQGKPQQLSWAACTCARDHWRKSMVLYIHGSGLVWIWHAPPLNLSIPCSIPHRSSPCPCSPLHSLRWVYLLLQTSWSLLVHVESCQLSCLQV